MVRTGSATEVRSQGPARGGLVRRIEDGFLAHHPADGEHAPGRQREQLREVPRAVGRAAGHAQPGMRERRVEDVGAVARAVHPPVHDPPVRILVPDVPGDVLPGRDVLDEVHRHPVERTEAIGIGVREEVAPDHVLAVRACDPAQGRVVGQGSDTVRGPFGVDERVNAVLHGELLGRRRRQAGIVFGRAPAPATAACERGEEGGEEHPSHGFAHGFTSAVSTGPGHRLRIADPVSRAGTPGDLPIGNLGQRRLIDRRAAFSAGTA